MSRYKHMSIWSNPPKATLSLGQSGPVRVDATKEDPDIKLRPVGFTAQIEPLEVEPSVWEGDYS